MRGNPYVKKLFFVSLIFLFSFGPISSLAVYSIPAEKPKGFVNDLANVIEPGAEQQLEDKLANFSADKKIEIAVLTIPTLNDEDIEGYSNEVFRAWGVGREGVNSGALLVVSINDRRMRIEVGYGLEGALTDAKSSSIIRNVIAPQFQNADTDSDAYAKGIIAGTDAMIQVVSGEEFNVPENKNKSYGFLFNDFTIFLALMVLSFIGSWFAKSKAYWHGGVAGLGIGAIIGLFVGFLWLGFIIMFALGFLGLLFDFFASRHGGKGGRGGFGGPFFGGFGRGGGSGGGFGGFGGGSSGGGGASGDW